MRPAARLSELRGDLAADDVEARLDRDLRDAGAHRTEPHDADRAPPPRRESRRIAADARASGGGAQLARPELQELHDVERHAKRVGDDLSSRGRGGGDELSVGLDDQDGLTPERASREPLEAGERRAVGRSSVADHDRATPAYRGRNGRRYPGGHPW